MKNLILIGLASILALNAGAQTYFNVIVPTEIFRLQIPTNTLATIESSTDNFWPYYYPDGVDTNKFNGQIQLDIGDNSTYKAKMLGPGTMIIPNQGDSKQQLLLMKFETVNTTPALSGYGVQPNGRAATVALETSADLKTWQVATNGTYPATNAAAFYRINFRVN